MSSDEEQQAVNPEDEDDVNFQLNPFDDDNQGYQSDNDNDDTQNENETAPNDDDEKDNEDNEDHETKPDGEDEDQGTTPDNDASSSKSNGHLKEASESIICKLTGENKQNENSTAPDDENDQQNEKSTTPDEDDDQQNENATAPDEDSDNKGGENDSSEKTKNDERNSKKSKKSDKASSKSDKNGKVEKTSQNMINQLIGGDDEHQTAEDFHSKSSNEEDDEEKNKGDEDSQSDTDSESEKEKSDDESEKNDSDNESKKEQSDDESENSESDKESQNEKSDEEQENPDELTDDFDDEDNTNDPSMMITEASNVVKPPKAPKQHTARKKPTFPPQPAYSDEEIIDQINIMMKDKKLPDYSYHQPIRNYISREQFAASEQHNYQRAELLESYLDMLTDLLNQIDTSEQEEGRRKSIEEKIQKVNEHHQDFVRRWNKEWNDKTQEQEKTKNSMEERQELEITDFKKRCSEESFIQKFNKPSQTLINLRKAENQMAMSKLFDRAKALKKKADELQKAEQMEAQKRMNDNVYSQYQQIESRHQREKECFEQHNQSIFDTLEKKRDKEQRNYEMAITMLKAQLDPPPNKDRVEIIKPQTAKRPIRNNRNINSIKSPASLDIQIVDFSKFTKTRKIIKPTTATVSSRKNTKK